MKLIFAVKYFFQNFLIAGLVVAGGEQPLNEAFYNKTTNYFTKVGDVRRAFNLYLKNNGIDEKPYFLKNGFQLKTEFKMEVIGLTDEELVKTYQVNHN